MTFQLFKGYMMAISTGLIIVAAIVLVALQWAKPAQMTIYGKDVEPTTLVVIVASAVGGILLVLLARAFVHGVGIIRRARHEQSVGDISAAK